MEYKILNTIHSPDDVKNLKEEQLNTLCDEIRSCLIETVSKNGGHLASNLGCVELTVAIHRVFHSPEDSILFDVGHQSYTHKLLTGRFERFGELRKEGGISGFQRPDESEHDPFITGHSSNSVSAAYGIYKAKSLQGLPGTAVAVIGDGATTGGMFYEALNNAGAGKNNFIVILNDNKISISKNVGSMARYLTRIRSKASYHSFKNRLDRFLRKIPLIGMPLRNRIYSSKIMLKNAIYHSNVFEGLGFTYFGPVDGHDIKAVENLLRIAKDQHRPVLVHVVTKKGKGYSFAESNPGEYHGVSSFDPNSGTGERKKNDYSAVAGKALCRMAEEDPKICAITAAMTQGTGLTEFATRFRNRFFDVGIAEQHAVTFAGGLASKGMKPYFAVYSSFLQRGYDQLIHDVAIAGLPVRFLIDRAGVVGEDGETHQGLFDVSFLSAIPNMTLYSPASFEELTDCILGTANQQGPVAIRYPRGCEKIPGIFSFTAKPFDRFGAGEQTAVVTYGRVAYEAYSACLRVPEASLFKINRVVPVAPELIRDLLHFPTILLLEEGMLSGGVAEWIACRLCEAGYQGKVRITAVENRFVGCADVESSLYHLRLDAESIEKQLRGEEN